VRNTEGISCVGSPGIRPLNSAIALGARNADFDSPAVNLAAPSPRHFFGRFFAQLDRRERVLVWVVMRLSRATIPTRLCSAVNWLANGWLYLVSAGALVLIKGQHGIRPLLAASCAVAVAFVVYARLKPGLARIRPCHSDLKLRSAIDPLDEYSCPSGHCMTASAVAVPLLLSFPDLSLIVFLIWILVAWARIACGHHYPSDVALGAFLGITFAVPICAAVL
jgi:undecaprenyl-diphosphatase